MIMASVWKGLKADYLFNKELCLECYRVLYIPMNAINILQKNSSPSEFFYDFQLTSVKKKETHGLKHVIQEY